MGQNDPYDTSSVNELPFYFLERDIKITSDLFNFF